MNRPLRLCFMTTFYPPYHFGGDAMFVYRLAQTHRLCGWVRNRHDGRVELLACGSEETLDELEKWLEIGPEYAKVTNIEVITENHADIPITFEVFPTI